MLLWYANCLFGLIALYISILPYQEINKNLSLKIKFIFKVSHGNTMYTSNQSLNQGFLTLPARQNCWHKRFSKLAQENYRDEKIHYQRKILTEDTFFYKKITTALWKKLVVIFFQKHFSGSDFVWHKKNW